MSKKKFLSIVLCWIVFGSWLSAANLVDIYQKGGITLKSDPFFGAKTNWSEIFYNNYLSLTAAPDGCVFVSDIRQNKIYKFDKNGNLIKSFGQAGCGPGDLLNPYELSILDNQFLVVRESSTTNRRISIFDLNGCFVDIVRGYNYFYKAIALRNNKIAYYVVKAKPDGNYYLTVEIVDFRTKKVVPVVNFKKKIKYNVRLCAKSYETDVYLKRINGGDLLVAYSGNPEITVYSCEGEKKYSFPLKLKHLEVSAKMKEEFIAILKEPIPNSNEATNSFKTSDLDGVLPRYVPLFRMIWVDSDDNILVVKHDGFDTNCSGSLDFQVYSKTGEYLCDSRVFFYNFVCKKGFEISFLKNAFYCIMEKENEDDSIYKLVKINLQ